MSTVLELLAEHAGRHREAAAHVSADAQTLRMRLGEVSRTATVDQLRQLLAEIAVREAEADAASTAADALDRLAAGHQGAIEAAWSRTLAAVRPAQPAAQLPPADDDPAGPHPLPQPDDPRVTRAEGVVPPAGGFQPGGDGRDRA